MNTSSSRKFAIFTRVGTFHCNRSDLPKLSLSAVMENKVNIDESLIKLLFFPSLEKLEEYHQPQGLNYFHVNIPFSDLTFLLTKSSFDDGFRPSVPLDIYLPFDWIPDSNTLLIPGPSKSMT